MDALSATRYPALRRRAEAAAGKLEVVAVIKEDLYETSHGDGEFHYLWNVFDTPADAARQFERIVKSRCGAYAQWGEIDRRAVSIVLRGDAFEVQVHGRERADEFDDEEILQALEDRHGTGCRRVGESLEWLVAWDAEWLVAFAHGESYFCYHGAAVDTLLARDARPAAIHRVAQIEGGVPGPGIERAKWDAGVRIAGENPP